MPSLDSLSHILLWIAVIFEGIIVLALTRQIGLLHERLRPTGARVMNVGPQIGQPVPPFDTVDIQGRRVTLGTSRDKRTLLLFISAGCSDCAALIPYLKDLAHNERSTLEVKLVTFGSNPAAAQQYAKTHALDSSTPLVLSDELALRYQVSLAPYCLLIDQAGVLRAKGLVNTFAHVESLLNAEELGVRSLQDFMQRQEEMQPS